MNSKSIKAPTISIPHVPRAVVNSKEIEARNTKDEQEPTLSISNQEENLIFSRLQFLI
jgi:hypothetical protein